VSPECVSRLETIGEVLDRIEQRGRKDSD